MSSQPSTGVTATAQVNDHVRIQIFPLTRSVPRSAGEWTALVKIASGELDIPARDMTRLVQLGLVVTPGGDPALTQHGRLTLGLPE